MDEILNWIPTTYNQVKGMKDILVASKNIAKKPMIDG
jgi:hypothetical protein